MNDLPRTFAALSDPTRLGLVEKLMRLGELPAGELSSGVQISAPAVSRHLKVLREAGLIDQRIDGTHRYYSVRPEAMRAISNWTMDHRTFWAAGLDRLDSHLALEPDGDDKDAPQKRDQHMKDTHEAEFTRDYKVSVARLWSAVTDPDEVIQWFGPEGVDLIECQMDFSATGPWTCTMLGRESGQRFKVSGTVTSVRPPQTGAPGTVGFTWAWHDNDDRRGTESHVTFTVSTTETGARLVLHHHALADLESAQSHSRGWLSTLSKLDRHIG